MKKHQKKPTQAAASGKAKTVNPYFPVEKNLPLLTLGIALIFTACCRIGLLDVPFERDEGEYAYVGQQLLHGVPPFESIYHVKLPGIYAAYALIEVIFGETIVGIHTGLLIINLLTAVVVFAVGKRFLNSFYAALAAAVFCLMSLSQKFYGFSANAEHFVILPAMLGILFLLRATSPEKNPLSGKFGALFSRPLFNFFLSGLLLGISYIIKQHGLFFIVFAVVFMLYKWYQAKPLEWKNILRNGSLFGAGIILPLGILCLIFLHLGLFHKFWWWTWQYPRQYITQVSPGEGWGFFKFAAIPMWNVFWPMLLLSCVGIIGLLQSRQREKSVFIIGLFILTLLALSAGLYFFPHYFLYATVPLGLLCAYGGEFISSSFNKSGMLFLKTYGGAVVLVFCLFAGIIGEKDYLFKYNGTMVAASSYGKNPFPESLVLGKYLKRNTSPEDKIAIFGSEPQIFFYADRASATGFVYTYEMMKDQPYSLEFESAMMKEIQEAMPKYILYVFIKLSWFTTLAKGDSYIFDESHKFIDENYLPSGIVDIGDRMTAIYCWEDPLRPGNECTPPVKEGYDSMDYGWIAIYKRKGAK